MNAQTVRRVVPLAAAAAVLAVLVGGAAFLGAFGAGGSGSEGSGSDGAGSGAKPRALQLSSVLPEGKAGQGGFELRTDLPDGPAEGAVRTFGRPSREAVAKLARALGLDAQVRESQGWLVAHDGAGTLRVPTANGNTWTFSREGDLTCMTSTGAARPGSPESSVTAEMPPDVACRVPGDGSGSSSGQPTGSVSEEQARKVAGPVLEAVGADVDEATVLVQGAAATVSVEPALGGSATTGVPITLTIDSVGVRGGQGVLGPVSEGDTYPLIGAKEAFERLNSLPVPAAQLVCPDATEGSFAPLACTDSRTVVGAELGLSLQWEADRPLLVPSWLFRVAKVDRPVAIVAVDPAYLELPTDSPLPTGEPTSVPGSPGTGGGAPGSTGTALPPDPGEPTMPSAAPAPATRFAVTQLDARTLSVKFFGGAPACFSYRVEAAEDSDTVRLDLQETVSSNARCIELAKEYTKRVMLDRPLGDRRVVDGESGQQVKVGR